jgi:hypothetical protein
MVLFSSRRRLCAFRHWMRQLPLPPQMRASLSLIVDPNTSNSLLQPYPNSVLRPPSHEVTMTTTKVMAAIMRCAPLSTFMVISEHA